MQQVLQTISSGAKATGDMASEAQTKVDVQTATVLAEEGVKTHAIAQRATSDRMKKYVSSK